MDLDRISDCKIKVSLSEDELLRYDLDVDDTTDRDALRLAVSDLLFDLGEREQDAEREHLLVAIHRLASGGAELFITRLPISFEIDGAIVTRTDFFSFSSLNLARRALRIALDRFGDIDIRLYRSYLGGFIASVPHITEAVITPFDILSELGEHEPSLSLPLSPEWFEPVDFQQ